MCDWQRDCDSTGGRPADPLALTNIPALPSSVQYSTSYRFIYYIQIDCDPLWFWNIFFEEKNVCNLWQIVWNIKNWIVHRSFSRRGKKWHTLNFFLGLIKLFFIKIVYLQFKTRPFMIQFQINGKKKNHLQIFTAW